MIKRIFILIAISLYGLTSFSQELLAVDQVDTTFSGINSLNLIGDFSKITIEEHSSRDTHVSGVLKSAKLEENYKIDLKQEGSMLSFKIIYPEKKWSSHSGHIVIKIPQGTEITISNTSGYVYLNDLTQTKAVVSTVSGRIFAKNLNGEVSLSSKTGDINASQIKGDLITKSTQGKHYIKEVNGTTESFSSSGAINLSTIKGIAKTESSDGNQTLEDIDGELNIKSSAGSVKVSKASGKINAVTFSGAISFFDIKGEMDIKTSSGTQTGNRIQISASSTFHSTEGNIKMRLDNAQEQLTFLLQSDSSVLHAFGKSKKKKLKIGKGTIVITGISTTGSQSYY